MPVFRSIWSATVSYAAGDLVNYSGVVYEALNQVTASPNNENPSQDPTNWEVSYVERVESLNSIFEIVKQELNTDDPSINSAITEFIHRGSDYVLKAVRPPTTRVSTIIQTEDIAGDDYEGRIYIRIPVDLLQVENMRLNNRSNRFNNSVTNQGVLEIKAAQSDYDFQALREISANTSEVFFSSGSRNYTSPVYKFVTIGGTSYFEIAPSDLGTGEDVELLYYRSEPQLGTIHPRVDSMGNPLNEQGQTEAQWVQAGNSPGTFIQQQVRIETNWFTSQAPYCIVYAALEHASAWLKDTERTSHWRQKYLEEEQRTIDFINRFEEDRPTDIQMYNPYSY